MNKREVGEPGDEASCYIPVWVDVWSVKVCPCMSPLCSVRFYMKALCMFECIMSVCMYIKFAVILKNHILNW